MASTSKIRNDFVTILETIQDDLVLQNSRLYNDGMNGIEKTLVDDKKWKVYIIEQGLDYNDSASSLRHKLNLLRYKKFGYYDKDGRTYVPFSSPFDCATELLKMTPIGSTNNRGGHADAFTQAALFASGPTPQEAKTAADDATKAKAKADKEKAAADWWAMGGPATAFKVATDGLDAF